jgi:cytochrome c553
MSLRNFLTISLATAALACAGAATAAGKSGNVVAGKDKAKVCASCHGVGNTGKLENGSATADNIPTIAGQHADYLAKALQDYRAGKRTDPIMTGQAKGLSDQDIADLAAYFGSLDSEIHDLSQHVKN